MKQMIKVPAKRIWTSILSVMLVIMCTLSVQTGIAHAEDNNSVPLQLAKGVKVDIQASADLNEALNQLGAAFKTAVEDDNALVYNATDKTVVFYCYNDNDSLHLVAARKPTVAPNHTGLLNKGPNGYGPTIQVRVNDTKAEYDVKRKHAYIWDGEGFKETVTS